MKDLFKLNFIKCDDKVHTSKEGVPELEYFDINKFGINIRSKFVVYTCNEVMHLGYFICSEYEDGVCSYSFMDKENGDTSNIEDGVVWRYTNMEDYL